MADMEEVIGKEWKMVEIETRRRSKRQRKDLRGAVGGWENIGLRTGRDGSNRYEEDTIGTAELEGCQRKKSNVRSLSNFPSADTTSHMFNSLPRPIYLRAEVR